ncbi:hypothetical protein PYJP_01840 [Pyrofollis japonicus]|nr:hypothetical protein PYJP_01840 [Pyrofollis japonicus]
MVGPSGIGKTSLARKLQEEIVRRKIVPLYLGVIKPPSTSKDLIDIFQKSVPNTLGRALRELIVSIIKGIFDKALGPNWDKRAPLLSTIFRKVSSSDPLDFISDVIINIASNVKEKGYRGVILIIDEAQNLIKGLNIDNLWSFIKLLAELQENPPEDSYVQTLLVTSDYMFQQKMLQNAPSLDYIDTFYLGEMTRRDASALYNKLCLRASKSQDTILDVVGGHPELIREICRRTSRYICRNVKKIEQFILVELEEIKEKDKKLYEKTISVLEAIARKGYVGISEIVGVKNVIDSLVEKNILQYACREYVGIIKWNKECTSNETIYDACGGGGFCGGLDIVAPSNRAALIGLYEAIVPENRKKYLSILNNELKSIVLGYTSICQQ